MLNCTNYYFFLNLSYDFNNPAITHLTQLRIDELRIMNDVIMDTVLKNSAAQIHTYTPEFAASSRRYIYKTLDLHNAQKSAYDEILTGQIDSPNALLATMNELSASFARHQADVIAIGVQHTNAATKAAVQFDPIIEIFFT